MKQASISIFVLVLSVIIGLLSVSCLADNARKVNVIDEFAVREVQGRSPSSLIVDDDGHIWYSNSLSADSIAQLDHDGSNLDRFRSVPPMMVGHMTTNNGLIYMHDVRNRRIVVATFDKQQISSFPYSSQIQMANQIAVNSQGTVYMTDNLGSQQVWRMTMNGTLLPPLIPYPPFVPACMTLDHNDILYVVDNENNRIFQFSPNGDQIGIFLGSPTIGIILSIIVDNELNVYLATVSQDFPTGRIVKLSEYGTVIGSFEEYATSIAVDNRGNLFITQNSDGHITKLSTSSMQQIDQWQNPYPVAMFVGVMHDPQGEGFLSFNRMYNSVIRFHKNGTLFSNNQIQLLDVMIESGTMGADNNLYMSSMNGVDVMVNKISSDGKVVSFVTLPLYTNRPFAVGPDGDIYMLPHKNEDILTIFSDQGNTIRQISIFKLTNPTLIRVNVNSSIFILDGYEMIYHLSPHGDLLWSFNCSSYGVRVSSFAIDTQGGIYVTDSFGNHFIHIQRNMEDPRLDFVTDYMFEGYSLVNPNVMIGYNSSVYLSDFARIIILEPASLKPSSSSNEEEDMISIISATVSSIVFLVAVGVAVYRFLYRKQLDLPSINQSVDLDVNDGEESSNYRHVSRRDRFCRRGARVNFLHNYHDNARFAFREEDSADYVLYI